jgi:hypothetical protein
MPALAGLAVLAQSLSLTPLSAFTAGNGACVDSLSLSKKLLLLLSLFSPRRPNSTSEAFSKRKSSRQMVFESEVRVLSLPLPPLLLLLLPRLPRLPLPLNRGEVSVDQ